MSWTRLTLQVRTPLFSGDDPAADSGTAIRVPSIRGALRFWFRAVAAGHGVSDLEELWNAERAVFGSTETPSPIRLRVEGRQPTVSGRRRPDWVISEERARRPGFDGAQYLLGQGLWDYKQGLRRGCVEPGEQFTLGIRFSTDEQVNARFMLTLWAWLTFGGLGARTRRGFGQLACTDARGDLPGGWTPADLLPPLDADGWNSLGECAVPDSLPDHQMLGWDGLLPGPPPDGEPLPEFSVLAPRWWTGLMLGKKVKSLGESLHWAGLRWRQFRAGMANGDHAKPSSRTRSPEWLNVIRSGYDPRYPIAALGLPVGYFSSSGDKIFKAIVTPEFRREQLRRASPVWLRPVLLPGGQWGVFTHVLFARLLPTGAELQVVGDRPQTLKPPSDEVVEEAWDCWIAWNRRKDITLSRLPNSYYREA